MDERTATVNIGGQEYEMLLTTRATKAIAGRYGGLENLGEKLMKAENFEMALDEIVWLITLLCNQPILVHNLKHPFRLRKPQKLPVAFPQVHEQAKRQEPHLVHTKGEMGHAVIQKPGKQFSIAYPAAVFFPSGSLSIFRFVPRYMASMMASL